MKKSVEKAEISKAQNEEKKAKSNSKDSESKEAIEPNIKSDIPKNTPKERARKTAEAWRKAALNKAVAS